MHLTGGQFKGRTVITPTGYDVHVKPTLSKVRESVFNILYSHFADFSNLSFFDMFTGSGIMALEAYSRGFMKVFAAEKNPKTFALTKQAFSLFNAGIFLQKADSIKLLKTTERKFDVIYIDPPWDYNYIPILEAAYGVLNDGGIMAVEYDKKKTKYPSSENILSGKKEILPFKEKIYGRCKLDFFTK